MTRSTAKQDADKKYAAKKKPHSHNIVIDHCITED